MVKIESREEDDVFETTADAGGRDKNRVDDGASGELRNGSTSTISVSNEAHDEAESHGTTSGSIQQLSTENGQLPVFPAGFGGKDVAKYSHGDDKRGRRHRHKDDSLLFDFDVDLTEDVPVTMKLGLRENSCGMVKKVCKSRDRAVRKGKNLFDLPLNPSVYLYEQPEPGGFEDPLPDSLYEGDHKRMERDEKRVTTTERTRIMEEKDRLVTQMEQLESGEWIRYIGGITKIHNMGDKEELARKRELTLKECRFMVKLYDQFKEREKQYVTRKKELSLAMLNDPKYADTDLYVEKPYNGRKAGPVVSIFYHRALNIENEQQEEEEEEEEEEEVHEEYSGKTLKKTSASKVSKARSSSSIRSTPAKTSPPPENPFTSFFENPKLVPSFEDMLKLRRSRRAPLAWGKPIPEMDEEEFWLPW